MTRVYLGFGSNLGDRLKNLRIGVEALAASGDVQTKAISSIYRSEPLGVTDQPEFLNAVVAIETTLGPRELLLLVQEIEREAGRRRAVRWGPRTLDIDILLFGDLLIDEEDLKVPHPGLIQRRFVLEPLLEIAPDISLPNGSRVGELLAGIGPEQSVWRDDSLVIEP